jgi:hypothetical protein
MNVELGSQVDGDIEDFVAREDIERVLSKIDEIEEKLDLGVSFEKAVEKRLGKGWSPMLQQGVGDYRVWFVEGSKTEKGDEGVLYVVRILDKDTQQKLMGVEINPDAYL